MGYTKHGYRPAGKKNPTYLSWQAMKMRCMNPHHKKFHLYGGRGIKVCERWLESFANFLADMGERPGDKTLDRYPNVDGDYEPNNCRWGDIDQQHLNRRKYARGNVAKTRCPRGHEYAGDNLYINKKSGKRTCKACNSMFNLQSKARRRAVLVISAENGASQ